MIIPCEIQQLLNRYLDGLTSVEEEDRLADFFRSHDVPEAWQAYKEMFAYFDAGMPIGETTGMPAAGTEKQEETVAKQHPHRHRRIALWTGLSVAAAAALTLVILRPVTSEQSSAVMPATRLAAVTAVSSDTVNQAQRDTVKTVPAARPMRKKPVRRYRDTPAKPPTYYASVSETEEVPVVTPADEYMIDIRLRQIEEEQNRSIAQALLRQENMARQIDIDQTQKTMAQASEEEDMYIEEYP